MSEGLCILTAAVEIGQCWGRVVSEDSGTGACDLCVQICPEVFEKPMANRCARVRAGVDLATYTDRVVRAARRCPVNAIHVTPSDGSSFWWSTE
jgi:ferredoxin